MNILSSPFVVLLFLGLSGVLVTSKPTASGSLLVGDEAKFFTYDTNGKRTNQIADVGAHSIDYDCKNKEIVWTSWDTKTVYVQGKKMITLPTPTNLAPANWFPKSVAVDSSSHKIYVGNIADHSVVVYDKSKSNPKQIHRASGSLDTQKWHLAIDSKKSYLFIQSDAQITRMDLKKGTTKIIYSDQVEISRITVDASTHRVYWLNAEAGKIISVNYEGRDEKVHYEKTNDSEDYSSFDSLTIINGILYWADFDNNKLIKLDLSGKTPKTISSLSDVETHALKGINC